MATQKNNDPLEKLKKRLLGKIKIPGWVLIACAVFRGVPDLAGETDWWWGKAHLAGPVFARSGAVISSPYFPIAMAVAGVAWLALVGEPKKRIRHPFVPILGWTVAIFIGLAMFGTAIAGYVAGLLTPIERHLTADQKSTIIREAELVAPHFVDAKNVPLQLVVSAADTPETNGYAVEIMQALKAGKIGIISLNPLMPQPARLQIMSTTIHGLIVQVKDPKKPPRLAAELKKILKDAGIEAKYGTLGGVKDQDFMLSVAPP